MMRAGVTVAEVDSICPRPALPTSLGLARNATTKRCWVTLWHADAPPPFQPGKPVSNIYYGACSWTLIDAGTFYPANARTAADRLTHYARQFPIVEVDATYYALPSERNARLWRDRTPNGFVFNIKAFGLFTHHPVVLERLPAAKELLPAAMAGKRRVYRPNHGFSGPRIGRAGHA
jgi:hypothetical protein